MIALSQFLQNRDAFGHKVSLNTRHGNGSEQTSRVGGVLTLLCYGFILAYMVIKAQKMTEGNLDSIASSEESIDFEQEG